MAKKIFYISLCVALLVVLSSGIAKTFAAKENAKKEEAKKEKAPATKKTTPKTEDPREKLNFKIIIKGIVETLIYSILGMIVLLVGFKALDAVTPFSLNKEIAEDDNTSAGVVVAGMMIGLGLIIGASVMSL